TMVRSVSYDLLPWFRSTDTPAQSRSSIQNAHRRRCRPTSRWPRELGHGSATDSLEERDDRLAPATCASRRARGRVSVGKRSPIRCEGVTMEAEPRLHFVNIADVPWTEVIAQLHGERRVSVHEKFLEWNAKRMVVLGRYDPHVVIERHGHASDHLVYVLDG